METSILEKALEKQSLKLWDPFCGSGTILLESLSKMYELPVNDINNFILSEIPTYDKNYILSKIEK